MLKLPKGAEAGFRLVVTEAWGSTFTMHLYGAGRKGWYLLSRRSREHDRDEGPTPLGKGQWRTFLNLIKQARFWDLPALWPDPIPDVAVDDGELIDIAGREPSRFHKIHRFVWRETGLDPLIAFCLKIGYPKDHLHARQIQRENADSSNPPEQTETPDSHTLGCEPN